MSAPIIHAFDGLSLTVGGTPVLVVPAVPAWSQVTILISVSVGSAPRIGFSEPQATRGFLLVDGAQIGPMLIPPDTDIWLGAGDAAATVTFTAIQTVLPPGAYGLV